MLARSLPPFAAAYQNASNVRVHGSIEEISNSPELQRSERRQAEDDLPLGFLKPVWLPESINLEEAALNAAPQFMQPTATGACPHGRCHVKNYQYKIPGLCV